MTRKKADKPQEGKAPSVKLALGKSKQVKVKVENAAEQLSSSNQAFKSRLEQGKTVMPVQTVLADSIEVEGKVQEAAADLHDINELLLQGVDDLRQSEQALERSQTALADSQAALATVSASETRARHRALHDGLTGLPNRELFIDRLTQAIAISERQEWSLAVLFLDLDHFKIINDSYGHAAGDAVLVSVAKRLAARCRDEDTVSRFAGDEFLFLLMNPKGRDNIESITDSILESVAQPIEFGDAQLSTRVSIGISVYPDDGVSAEELIHLADKAMYQAKRLKLGASFFGASLAA